VADTDGTSDAVFHTTSAHGVPVALNANGTFQYDPRPVAQFQALNPGQSLTDTFTYQATDGTLMSAVTSVTVTVTGVADGPLYQNPVNRWNVNAPREDFVSPLDALVVINWINRYGAGPIPPGTSTPPYIDVNGDDACTAQDVLDVINWLNEPHGQGEGEAVDHARVGLSTNATVPGQELTFPELQRRLADYLPAFASDLPLSQRSPLSHVPPDPCVAVARKVLPPAPSIFDDWDAESWGLDEALAEIAAGLDRLRAGELVADVLFRDA
jgi:VCBS repeat-containing protein